MQINNDKKIDILLNLLKERYEASHKIRERSLNFVIWVSGFGVALIWILFGGYSLSYLQKIILTIFIIAGGILIRKFLKSIEIGFENNHKVMIKIEEILGCYEKNVYAENDALYPYEYKDLSKKETSHFRSIYIWLLIMGIALLAMIWVGACKQ